MAVSQLAPLYPGGHLQRKPLPSGEVRQEAFPWQGVEEQGSFISSQSLLKLLLAFEQGQLFSAKALQVELLEQEFERHSVSFLLQKESTRK